MTIHKQSVRAWLLLIAAVLLLAGSLPVHAQGGDSLPASARLNGIRHVYQTWNNCGGANLTMALSYFGWTADQDVARAWLKPDEEDKNVSPSEMAAFVNTQTNLDVRALWRYGGTLELVKGAIAKGFPIIIEAGFDVDDLDWMGHYETVAAYDDASQTFWVYDSYLGLGEDGTGETHSYADLDYWWRHFNRAYVLLYPPDREEEVRELLGDYVDPVYAADQALSTARLEAQANQTDGWAWFNAGMSSVKLSHYHDAAIYFDEAFRVGMPYRAMWYNFGPYEAYYRIGRYGDVLQLADNTDATTTYVEETNYWRGLALAALGRFDEAIVELDKAITFNPNFAAAQDAKASIQAGTYVAPAAPES